MLRGIGLSEVLVIGLAIGAVWAARRTPRTLGERGLPVLLGAVALGGLAALRVAPLELVLILAAGGAVAAIGRLTGHLRSRIVLAGTAAVLVGGLALWAAVVHYGG